MEESGVEVIWTNWRRKVRNVSRDAVCLAGKWTKHTPVQLQRTRELLKGFQPYF